MRRILFVPTALLLSALALSGCAAGSDQVASDSGGSAPVVAPESSEMVAGDSAVTRDADRQVIVTGWMTVTVEQPLDAADEAARIAESVGGRVDGRQEIAPNDYDRGSATLTLRLPADGLNETIDKLKQLGTVQEVSLNSSDVTMVTQDLDARIEALRASIDRLLALVGTATDTESLIALETAISDRQAQLESLEAERRYYSDQIALSTITLNLISPADTPATEPVTFLDGLVAGWNAFVAFFAGLIVVFGVLIPWLVLAGIITALILLLIRWRKARAAAAASAAPAPAAPETATPAPAPAPPAPAPAPKRRTSSTPKG
jgi:hypothetical protein